jgi:hypothetical protein
MTSGFQGWKNYYPAEDAAHNCPHKKRGEKFGRPARMKKSGNGNAALR